MKKKKNEVPIVDEKKISIGINSPRSSEVSWPITLSFGSRLIFYVIFLFGDHLHRKTIKKKKNPYELHYSL